MNAQDFSAGAVSQEYCLGSIFATSLGSGQGVPQWIVGDAFLKVRLRSRLIAASKSAKGEIFADPSNSSPPFLQPNQNVFSVYRYQPASVGFAALKGNSAQVASVTSGAVGGSSNSSRRLSIFRLWNRLWSYPIVWNYH